MSIDEQHVALPKLYGQPAYARPPRPVDLTPKPFDPDELPLQGYMTEEERMIASASRANGYLTVDARHGSRESASDHRDSLAARPFRLRSLAGRLLGGSL